MCLLVIELIRVRVTCVHAHEKELQSEKTSVAIAHTRDSEGHMHVFARCAGVRNTRDLRAERVPVRVHSLAIYLSPSILQGATFNKFCCMEL